MCISVLISDSEVLLLMTVAKLLFSDLKSPYNLIMRSVPSLVRYRKQHYKYVKHWLMSDRREEESCLPRSKCWLVKNDAPAYYAERKLLPLQRYWKPHGIWGWKLNRSKTPYECALGSNTDYTWFLSYWNFRQITPSQSKLMCLLCRIAYLLTTTRIATTMIRIRGKTPFSTCTKV